MAITAAHTRIDTQADDPAVLNAGGVCPSHWNAEHIVTVPDDAITPAMIDSTAEYTFAVVTTNSQWQTFLPWSDSYVINVNNTSSLTGSLYGTLTGTDDRLFTMDTPIAIIVKFRSITDTASCIMAVTRGGLNILSTELTGVIDFSITNSKSNYSLRPDSYGIAKEFRVTFEAV